RCHTATTSYVRCTRSLHDALPIYFWLLATAMGSGLFWLLAYLFIIYRGFKDLTYGMPIVAFVGNIAWEFIYGLGLEPVCPLTWADRKSTRLNSSHAKIPYAGFCLK